MTTSAIPVTMMTKFYSTAEQSWWTDITAKMLADFNPRNDPLTAQMQIARYNLFKMVIRHKEFHHVWRELGEMDSAIHEHMGESLFELYKDLFAVELLYETDEVAEDCVSLCDEIISNPKEMGLLIQFMHKAKELDKFIMHMTEHQGSMTEHEMNDGIKYVDITKAMVNLQTPMPAEFEQSLYKHNAERPARIVPKNQSEQQRSDLRMWANKLAPFQHDMDLSFELAMADTYLHTQSNNRLTGAAARNGRMLLVDDGIPLPTDATFLGWWQVSGIVMRRLLATERYLMEAEQGLRFTHIMTYVTPLMPATKEHANGGSVNTDDSHADHSLGIRSPGHHRDTHNRIDYGIQRVRTVLFDSDGPDSWHLVADDRNARHTLAVDGLTIHQAHVRMLPRFADTHSIYMRGGIVNTDAFLPGLNRHDALAVRSLVQDPWTSTGDYLPLNRVLDPRPTDVGYRSLAKFAKLHFRFDSESASDTWCNEFERKAIAHVRATPMQMTRVYLEAARATQSRQPIFEKKITTRGNVMEFKW